MILLILSGAIQYLSHQHLCMSKTLVSFLEGARGGEEMGRREERRRDERRREGREVRRRKKVEMKRRGRREKREGTMERLRGMV